MKKALFLLIGSMLCASVATAQIVNYSTSFTSADGFSDATALNGIDGWVSRTGTQSLTSNTGTTGQVDINGNGPGFRQQGSGGSWAAGDTISLSLDVFYTADSTGNNGLRLGFSDDAEAVDVGVQFQRNATGLFSFSGYTGGTSNTTNLGVSAVNNTVYTFNADITKSTTLNEFDVVWTWSGDAQTDSFTLTSAALYGASTVTGAVQYNGPTGGQVAVGAYSQSVAVVPEPSTFLLSGLGTMLLTLVRRKK